MSDRSKLPETRAWLQAWRQEGTRGARMIAGAATKQRANLETIKHSGRNPSWANTVEYEHCVKLLEEGTPCTTT